MGRCCCTASMCVQCLVAHVPPFSCVLQGHPDKLFDSQFVLVAQIPCGRSPDCQKNKWASTWFWICSFSLYSDGEFALCRSWERLRFYFAHNTALNKSRRQTVEKLKHYWCFGAKDKKIGWGRRRRRQVILALLLTIDMCAIVEKLERHVRQTQRTTTPKTICGKQSPYKYRNPCQQLLIVLYDLCIHQFSTGRLYR